HFQVIDQLDDGRRPARVLYFHGLNADPCENFALPANHRPVAGAPCYKLLQADCPTQRQHKGSQGFRPQYRADRPSENASPRGGRLKFPYGGSNFGGVIHDADASAPVRLVSLDHERITQVSGHRFERAVSWNDDRPWATQSFNFSASQEVALV